MPAWRCYIMISWRLLLGNLYYSLLQCSHHSFCFIIRRLNPEFAFWPKNCWFKKVLTPVGVDFMCTTKNMRSLRCTKTLSFCKTCMVMHFWSILQIWFASFFLDTLSVTDFLLGFLRVLRKNDSSFFFRRPKWKANKKCKKIL